MFRKTLTFLFEIITLKEAVNSVMTATYLSIRLNISMSDEFVPIPYENVRDNALTYGRTPSSPASITPLDINQWKATVEPTFKHYFKEKYDILVRDYEKLVREYQVNKLLYESAVGFEPIIGVTYYLYMKRNNTAFLSIISPTEIGRAHV